MKTFITTMFLLCVLICSCNNSNTSQQIEINDETVLMHDGNCFHLKACSKFAVHYWVKIKEIHEPEKSAWCSLCIDYETFLKIKRICESCEQSRFEVSMAEDSIIESEVPY